MVSISHVAQILLLNGLPALLPIRFEFLHSITAPSSGAHTRRNRSRLTGGTRPGCGLMTRSLLQPLQEATARQYHV